MKHTLLSFQRRLSILQVLFAALAIVLLLQVGTRFDSTIGTVNGNSLYGPLPTHSGPPVKREHVRKHPSAKKAVRKAAKPSRRSSSASSQSSQ